MVLSVSSPSVSAGVSPSAPSPLSSLPEGAAVFFFLGALFLGATVSPFPAPLAWVALSSPFAAAFFLRGALFFLGGPVVSVPVSASLSAVPAGAFRFLGCLAAGFLVLAVDVVEDPSPLSTDGATEVLAEGVEATSGVGAGDGTVSSAVDLAFFAGVDRAGLSAEGPPLRGVVLVFVTAGASPCAEVGLGASDRSCVGTDPFSVCSGRAVVVVAV